MKYTFNTQFNVGDMVWLMDGSRPHKAEIIGIRFPQRQFESRIEELYDISDFEYLLRGTPTKCYGFEAFATKAELIQSLMDKGDKE